MPSAFTPNGDGKNDIFQIPPSNRFVKVDDFSVFNRYGERAPIADYGTITLLA
jgi:gliding motility-associated-like protein